MRHPRSIAAVLMLALAACQPMPPPSDMAAVPSPPPTVPPLELLTRTRIPPSARTVEQAAAYLLEPTGYRLALSCAGCPAEAAEIARKPVSPLALKPQLTTIQRALVLVAGSEVHLLVDDKTRLVSFATQPPSGPVSLEAAP